MLGMILINFYPVLLKDPGHREVCMEFNDLISCEAGVCKNMSQIWDCNFKDKLTSLEQDYTVDGKVLEGWCNCNRCPESNAR